MDRKNVARLLVICLIAGKYIFHKNEDMRPIMANEVFNLKKEEIPELEASARTGNIKAAKKLANYYVFILNDGVKEIEWLRCAAVYGDIHSQYELAMRYLNYAEVKDQAKGKFWLKKAADSGDMDARKMLDTSELQTVSQAY